MTIPRERFRALRWARDWLKDVALDPLVPPDVKAEAEFLLQGYPSDQLIRAAISRQVALSKETLEALSAATRWLFSFNHPTSNPDALHAVLRHMPTPAELATQVYMQDPSRLSEGRLLLSDWLEPDEDYVQAFVMGWDEDCAVAVGIEWVDANEDELEDASPLYLITSSTSGVNYQSLKTRQLVLCTVPRSWDGADRRWKYVKSCDAAQDVSFS